MRLYVDDIRRCPDGWHLVRSVTEAIRILATMEVEEISLDHDIAHYKQVGEAGLSVAFDCNETYEAVAWYLALMPSDKRPIIHIHTANPVGEEKMRAILGL